MTESYLGGHRIEQASSAYSRLNSTIVATRAQRARHAPQAQPQQGNMDQGQQAPQAPQAQPPPQAPQAQPPPLPAPLAPPAPQAFALGPGRSHAVLDYDDPNTGATATKLYNKAISPHEEKFDGEADNLAVFLASFRDRARRFNWQRLVMVPIDDGTTRNILTHYGQVSLENTRTHTATYVNMPTRDAQDNDMFYYFLSDSLTNEFRTTVLLYAEMYTVTNVPVASSLLKHIIILTRDDNPVSTMHIRETLIESRSKLVTLKGNITEFNQWVRKQTGRLHAQEQEAVDLLYCLWKAYKAAPNEESVTYIKDLKSQCNDRRATFTAEDIMVGAENKYEARLLDEENIWGIPTEEQEKIVAMITEINSLKKERGRTSSKTNKQKQAAKKQAPKKAASKRPTDKKKKTNDKWAWKNKAPKESDTKENDTFVKTFETKKYFWCKNHNNGAGMWTLHHPNICESGSGPNKTTTNANLAAFNTVDSDTE